jgi:cell division protein FtsB
VLRVPSLSWIAPGLLALFILPALAYGGYTVGDRWYQNYVLAQEEAALRADVQRLRETNVRLQRDLDAARGDAQIEKAAREQLGLVKPGDRPIQIVGPPGAAPPEPAVRREAPPPERPITVEKPSWLRVLDAIFGR